VIFVTMRHQQGPQFVPALADVGEVVDNDIDAEHLVVGEHQSAVDHDHVVVGLDDRHVAPDLAATAERDDAGVRHFGGRGDGQNVSVQ
jgi:hypothetical protein